MIENIRVSGLYLLFQTKFIDADTAAIRVSNLSENTQEGDLQELFKPFGHIARIYLAKDKVTGQCKVGTFITNSSVTRLKIEKTLI